MRKTYFQKGALVICLSIVLYKIDFVLSFFQDFYTENEIPLSAGNVQNILSEYKKFAGHVDCENNKKKKLIFAFSSDLDIHVDAVDLLNYLNCHSHIPNKYFTSLTDDYQICETLLYFFTHGVGSEIFVSNRQEFNKMLEIVQKLKRSEDLGGNSASMALRAFKECADVYLHSMMTTKYYNELFNSSIQIVPSHFLKESIQDIHIVIDFQEGEQYQSIIAPRTNRLYLQSDQDNTQFPGLDHMIEEVQLAQPHVFAIGGFQLMNQRPIEEIRNIIDSLQQKLLHIKQELPWMKLHFEMGAFTDEQLLREIVNKLFTAVHSTGMNEDEIQILLNYLKNEKITDESYQMSTNEVIQKAVELIGILSYDLNSTIDRIHFHTSSIQMICQVKNEWSNQKYALVRSILVGLSQAMKEENDNIIDDDFTHFGDLISNQVEVIYLYKLQGDTEKLSYHSNQLMSIDDLVRCWMINNNWECCIAPTIINAVPKRTSGLGDNIAATSLLYQIKQ